MEQKQVQVRHGYWLSSACAIQKARTCISSFSFNLWMDEKRMSESASSVQTLWSVRILEPALHRHKESCTKNQEMKRPVDQSALQYPIAKIDKKEVLTKSGDLCIRMVLQSQWSWIPKLYKRCSNHSITAELRTTVSIYPWKRHIKQCLQRNGYLRKNGVYAFDLIAWV